MNKYGLNDEQYAAVTDSAQVMTLNASAGSGKTRTLVAKILYLLDQGVSPKNILALTFSNRASNEMKTRLMAQADIRDMQVSTIHSMCVRVIRTFIHYTHLKLPFTIYDDQDQLSVLKTVIKSKGYTDDPYEVRGIISKAKSGQEEDQLESPIDEIYRQYQEILKANNSVDFDDLLILANQCLQHPDCKDHYSRIWKHILIDEFQDTSKLQYSIILSIYGPHNTLTLKIGRAHV